MSANKNTGTTAICPLLPPGYNWKKIKIKKEKKKEENSTELQKSNVEAEVYDNNKKMWLSKKE